MSIFTALYNLLIGPLELLFEIIFALANQAIKNPGLSIIFLSLAMNFLVLPLYRRADAMQEEERNTEQRLKTWTQHIKKTFKGDERFMMLQTYYRQNDYKPTDILKGSVSLLLEIPFFIAAYNFLSGLTLLQDESFGPIHDLGAPDGMLVLGGIAINVLPILMTLINLISSAIYTKGMPLHSKIQLYGMAAIFLVLLYQSPAGLVFYWTLNNLFSLVKNVFYKLKSPAFVLCVLSSVSSALLMAFVGFIHPMPTPRIQIFVLIFLALLQFPLLIYFARKKRPSSKSSLLAIPHSGAIFYTSCVFMAILTGILIPSAVMKTSPEEFINLQTMTSPLWYLLNSTLTAAGTFIIWIGIFYALASPAFKQLMSLCMWLLCGVSVIDYMFFGQNYGTMSFNLKYDVAPTFSVKEQLINLLVIILAAALLLLIWKKKSELAKVICLAAAAASFALSCVNIYSIHTVLDEKSQILEASHTGGVSIPLSKNGKNVVIFMLDRAINSYVPYILNEKPELARQFEGFTYYPNTMSFGPSTNFASPALYGGYEYTPVELNKRDTELLEDKHNEALKVMPVMFLDEGFETTVCDPSYAGYDWIPDLSIYDDYPEIHRFITHSKFTDGAEEMAEYTEKKMFRNFFCHSLFKISPVIVHPITYCSGNYNSATKDLAQEITGLTQASGINEIFWNDYAVLQKLPDLTQITDTNTNTFMMMANDVTHAPTLLQEPDYAPTKLVDNTAYDAAHADRFTLNGRTLHMDNEVQITHYHVNMAAFIQLGNWFDFLRENDLYDNTRIILVSDHGFSLAQLDDMLFGDKKQQDAMWYNPLLMVKDFNSAEFTTDMTFMTNADVPMLASDGLIQSPTNPFTKKPINSELKSAAKLPVFYSDKWSTLENNGTTFLPGKWFTVHDNIFDMNNWEIISD